MTAHLKAYPALSGVKTSPADGQASSSTNTGREFADVVAGVCQCQHRRGNFHAAANDLRRCLMVFTECILGRRLVVHMAVGNILGPSLGIQLHGGYSSIS